MEKCKSNAQPNKHLFKKWNNSETKKGHRILSFGGRFSDAYLICEVLINRSHWNTYTHTLCFVSVPFRRIIWILLWSQFKSEHFSFVNDIVSIDDRDEFVMMKNKVLTSSIRNKGITVPSPNQWQPINKDTIRLKTSHPTLINWIDHLAFKTFQLKMDAIACAQKGDQQQRHPLNEWTMNGFALC